MTVTGKWVVGAIIVLVILAAGGFYLFNASMSGQVASSTAMEGDMSGMRTGSSTSMSGSSTDSVGLPSGGNTSDASLQKDAAAIDAQMNALGSDNDSVSNGMNVSQ
jgi:hypothetical protein